jgi:hypothetical protein
LGRAIISIISFRYFHYFCSTVSHTAEHYSQSPHRHALKCRMTPDNYGICLKEQINVVSRENCSTDGIAIPAAACHGL